ncbi:MAG: acyl-CoA thioesterase [Myxococcaceae bacterium]|nr:acyl-CoA thioesterase [Myxococcaceae bacterium]
MANIDKDTALFDHEGQLSAWISPDWNLWGPNGGYLACIALRAAGTVARIRRPASLHVHYLRPASAGRRVSVHVRAVQSGQRAESISVLLEQDDKPVLTALIRTVQPCEGVEHVDLTMPQVVGPHEALEEKAVHKPHYPYYPFWNHFERRILQPESWDEPRQFQAPRWLEWFLLREPAPADPFLDPAPAVLLIDTLCWPAAWLQHGERQYIAPSLDLTVWFHSLGQTQWLLGDAHAPIARDGMVSGLVRIWTQAGAIVASGGSQLLCMPNRT